MRRRSILGVLRRREQVSDFTLHPRLEADTVFVGDWPLCRILLMNDQRFHWLILVPRVAHASEMFDLGSEDQAAAIAEAARAGAALKTWCGADKINIAALGNVVPQLHIHVIARKVGDAAWPAPVWSASGQAIPYPDPNAVASVLRAAL